MSQAICYEQPVNERTRALLRLEFLFQQMDYALAGTTTWDSRSALRTLFDILDITGRNEHKKGLLQDLQRHASRLHRLQSNPGIDQQALATVLNELRHAEQQISGANLMAVEMVRQNEFLAIGRQRFQMPGGACQFDLPALHHWLQQDVATRNQHLQGWLEPFTPLREAVFLLLRLIRDSASHQPVLATKGFFQCALSTNAPNQLIRVWLPRDHAVFPEISCGKQRFTIHFFVQSDLQRRAADQDIHFELACCAI